MEHIINRAMFVADILSGDHFQHASPECSPKGDGQCDGFDYATPDAEICDCPCHSGRDPLFEVATVTEVKAAHDTMWNWGA